jgi:hypothetical protein
MRRAKRKAKQIERPAVVTDEMLTFLDELRRSGVTNMFGARPYIEAMYAVDKETASLILSYWMRTFGNPKR